MYPLKIISKIVLNPQNLWALASKIWNIRMEGNMSAEKRKLFIKNRIVAQKISQRTSKRGPQSNLCRGPWSKLTSVLRFSLHENIFSSCSDPLVWIRTHICTFWNSNSYKSTGHRMYWGRYTEDLGHEKKITSIKVYFFWFKHLSRFVKMFESKSIAPITTIY